MTLALHETLRGKKKGKLLLTSILIKTQAKIDFISGRPQIWQDLTSDAHGPPQSYSDQKY